MPRKAALYKARLLAALEEFDLARSEALSEQLQDAEADGYVLTQQEDRLWERLTNLIHQYRRTLAHLD
jgi:flagellar biosynthesis/type III secretory pathway protein FliH